MHTDSISVKELGAALNSLNVFLSAEDLQRMLASVDRNRDGSLDMSEWLTLLVKVTKQSQPTPQPAPQLSVSRSATAYSGQGMAPPSPSPPLRPLSPRPQLSDEQMRTAKASFDAFDTDRTGVPPCAICAGRMVADIE